MPLYETNEDLERENETKECIEIFFGIKLNKLPKTHVMDFISSDGNFYEIKSRFNNHNKYPSTMIGYNKLQYINSNGKTALFVFNFLDGIYYYVYDKTKLNELEIKIGGRCDRGKQEYKLHAYIPVNLLVKLFSKPTPTNKMGKQKPNTTNRTIDEYIKKKQPEIELSAVII